MGNDRFIAQRLCMEQSKKSSERKSFVYFIRIGEPTSAIKIGTCKVANLQRRIGAFQTLSPYPVELLGAIYGDQENEAALHSELSAERISGEWFNDSETVRSVIARELEHPAPSVMQNNEAPPALLNRERLRKRLAEINSNQSKFGEHLGLPPSRITEIIQGRRKLGVIELKRAAEFLGMSVEAFLDEIMQPASKVPPLSGLRPRSFS